MAFIIFLRNINISLVAWIEASTSLKLPVKALGSLDIKI
jgi:hypothetical protein